MKLEEKLLEKTIDIGKMLKAQAFGEIPITWKSRDDPVTHLDKEAERLISEEARLSEEVNIIGEEYGDDENKASTRIYVDPIDGTKSYLRGEFNTSISVGVEREGVPHYGIVSDFMRDITYVASDEGVYMMPDKDTKIPLPRKSPFKKWSVMMEGKLTDLEKKLKERIEVSVRSSYGSIALNMAQVASGASDGIFMPRYSKPGKTDMLGAYILLEKAGCYITDIDGNPFDHNNMENGIVAVNPELTDVVKEILAK